MTHARLWLTLAGIAGITFACNIPNSVELGGTCIDRQMCKSPADACLDVEGDSYCTKQCSPANACPDGFECVEMNVTLHNAGGFHDIPGMGYCLPHAVTAKLGGS